MSGDSFLESYHLPQCGYGSDTNFNTLSIQNPFLFRVHTPKQRSPIQLRKSTSSPDDDIYFIAQRFDGKYTSSPCDLGPPEVALAGYADAARHLDWKTRATSPYVSASFSFAWAIWEAMKRFRDGVKRDVEIAVIDSRQLAGIAQTASGLLKMGLPKERHGEYWRWHRFAQESQCVLVYGYIPTNAVLTSIPLRSILESLPSYFLSPQPTLPRPRLYSTFSTGTVQRMVWPSPEPPTPPAGSDKGKGKGKEKLGYLHFCASMSQRFNLESHEKRMTDATVGAVRLALAFLEPWFEGQLGVAGDFDEGVEGSMQKMCELAGAIAVWPLDGQDGSVDLKEVGEVIRGIVDLLTMEVRDRILRDVERRGEVGNLYGMVDHLERIVEDYEGQMATHVCRDQVGPDEGVFPESPSTLGMGSDLDHEQYFVPSPSGTAVHSLPPSPKAESSPLKITIPPPFIDHSASSSPSSSPLHLSSFKTPVTSLSPLRLHIPLPDLDYFSSSSSNDSSPSTPTSARSFNAEPAPESCLPAPPELPSHSSSIQPPSSPEVSEPAPLPCDNVPTKLSIPSPVLSLSPSISYRDLLSSPSPLPYHLPGVGAEDGDEEHYVPERIPVFVTSFLIGAFLVLCLMSSQRRTLLTGLT